MNSWSSGESGPRQLDRGDARRGRAAGRRRWGGACGAWLREVDVEAAPLAGAPPRCSFSQRSLLRCCSLCGLELDQHLEDRGRLVVAAARRCTPRPSGRRSAPPACRSWSGGRARPAWRGSWCAAGCAARSAATARRRARPVASPPACRRRAAGCRTPRRSGPRRGRPAPSCWRASWSAESRCSSASSTLRASAARCAPRYDSASRSDTSRSVGVARRASSSSSIALARIPSARCGRGRPPPAGAGCAAPSAATCR